MRQGSCVCSTGWRRLTDSQTRDGLVPQFLDPNDMTMNRKLIIRSAVVVAIAAAAVAALRVNQADSPAQGAEAVTAGTANADAMPAWVAHQYEQNRAQFQHGSWERLFASSRW